MGTALLAVTEIPEETWNTLKPQLTSTALIRVEEISGVNVPFIHFHPTLAPYLRIMDNGRQTVDDMVNDPSSIVQRYWQEYYNLPINFTKPTPRHPIQARSIVLRELPNLKRALKLTIEAGALDEAVNFADSINRFLDYFGRWREMDEVTKAVEKAIQ